MMPKKKISKAASPFVFDGYNLSGLFPHGVDEQSMINVGQAYSVAMKANYVMLGHDGSQHAVKIVQDVGLGLTLQGTNVIINGLCSIDELRFWVMQDCTSHGIYVSQDIFRPGAYELRCMGNDGDILHDQRALVPIEKLANRGAFLPSIKFGGKSKVSENSTDKYCEKLVSAGTTRANQNFGKIVSNAPNLAIEHMLKRLEKAAQRTSASLDIVVSEPRDARRPAIPFEIGRANEFVSEAVIDHGAKMGLVWHAVDQAPDIMDETGKAISHRDVMLVIARCLLNERHGRSIIHDARCSRAVAALGRHPLSHTMATAPAQTSIRRLMREKRSTYGFLLPGTHIFSDLHFAASGLTAAMFVAGLATMEIPLGKAVSSIREEVGVESIV